MAVPKDQERGAVFPWVCKLLASWGVLNMWNHVWPHKEGCFPWAGNNNQPKGLDEPKESHHSSPVMPICWYDDSLPFRMRLIAPICAWCAVFKQSRKMISGTCLILLQNDWNNVAAEYEIIDKEMLVIYVKIRRMAPLLGTQTQVRRFEDIRKLAYFGMLKKSITVTGTVVLVSVSIKFRDCTSPRLHKWENVMRFHDQADHGTGSDDNTTSHFCALSALQFVPSMGVTFEELRATSHTKSWQGICVMVRHEDAVPRQ